MTRSQAAEQESRPAAFHLGSKDLDDGSLNSSQEFGNSKQMLCLGWGRQEVVGHGVFGDAGR